VPPTSEFPLEPGSNLAVAADRYQMNAVEGPGVTDLQNLLAGDGEIPQAEAYAASQLAARRAVVLDPELADAHVALADVSFYYEWDWATAEAEYLRAIDLGGSGAYARTQYANLLAASGRTDAARQQADRAVVIDPLSADVRLNAGLMAYYQRRYDEAREILRRVTVMDPRFPGAYRTLAAWLVDPTLDTIVQLDALYVEYGLLPWLRASPQHRHQLGLQAFQLRQEHVPEQVAAEPGSSSTASHSGPLIRSSTAVWVRNTSSATARGL